MNTPGCLAFVVACAWMILTNGPFSVYGVSCWVQREGVSTTCGMLFSENVTVDECCSNYRYGVISWSTVENLSPGEIFKFGIFGGVPECHLCNRTCEETHCPEGRKCVMKGGRPRCVCKPDCSANNTSHTHKGAVCATNGKEYKSMCALRKTKCRQQDLYYELDVAYYGPCQNSCDSVQCLENKCCVEDQHGRPHCVSYSDISCPGPFRDEFVCGADGVTYETLCQLRRTSCSRGNIISVAYEGKCKNLTSCNDTSCVSRKECYWDQIANTSRCILCNYSCSGWANKVPLCASDGETYLSWCEMQNLICQTGEYVELVHWGDCDPDGDNRSSLKELGSGHWGYDQIDFTPSSRQVLHDLRSSIYRNQEKDDNSTTTESTTLQPHSQGQYAAADGTSKPVSDKPLPTPSLDATTPPDSNSSE